MDQNDLDLRQKREKVYDKTLDRRVIEAFFEKNREDYDSEVIKNYLKLQKGPLSMDDFISLTMLLHHHQHVDLAVGYFVELNPLFKVIEHNRLFNQIELQAVNGQKLASRQHFFQLVTQRYESQSECSNYTIKISTLDESSKKIQNKLQVSLSSDFSDKKDYTELQNFNFPGFSDGKTISLRLIEREVDCEFLTKLLEVPAGEFEMKFSANCPLIDLNESNKSEYSVVLAQAKGDSNFHYLISQFFKKSVKHATKKENTTNFISQFLNSNGKIVLNESKKAEFLQQVFAFSLKDKTKSCQNFLLQFFWDTILIGFDNNFSESIAFFKTLAKNLVNNTFSLQISFLSLQLNVDICCREIEPLLLKFIDSLLTYHNALSLMEIEKLVNQDADKNSSEKTRSNTLTEMEQVDEYIKLLMEKEYVSNKRESVKSARSMRSFRKLDVDAPTQENYDAGYTSAQASGADDQCYYTNDFGVNK